jgi:hypothetical protein
MSSSLTTSDRPTTVESAEKSGNRWAALVLVVLTPVIAELAFGSTPLELAWLILLWLPIYGAGILLVRELVRRAGRGWPSIVVLGIAYELVEDGIGLQALSSPHLYGAADWGARILGLNVPYWEANVIYHVIFSALVPILLTDLLFPAHRRAPYLKNPGLVVTALVAVLGVAVLRVTVPPSQDPGYTAPLPVTVGCLLAVCLLAIIALRVLPARTVAASTTDRLPPIGALATLGLIGVILVLGLTFPFGGADQPAFTQGWWVLVPMAVAAALAASAYVAIRRWSRSAFWTDLQALALAAGALVAHTLAGVLAAATPFERIGLLFIAVLTVGLLLLLGRQIQRRHL